MDSAEEHFRELQIVRDFYLYELEHREKLHTRVQLVFAVLIIVSTNNAYIIKNVYLDYSRDLLVTTTIILAITSSFFSFIACYYLVKAFWGNKYFLIDTTDKILEYKEAQKKHEKEMLDYAAETWKNYPDHSIEIPDPHIQTLKQITKKLSENASENAKTNTTRSLQIHLSIRYILCAAISLILSASIFVMSDLDTSSPRKPLLIEEKNLTNHLGFHSETRRTSNVETNTTASATAPSGSRW